MKSKELIDLQKNQNRMLRLKNYSIISDKISTKSMLKIFKMRPVNQINAQIKLGDIWKATNMNNYPTKIKKLSDVEKFDNNKSKCEW